MYSVVMFRALGVASFQGSKHGAFNWGIKLWDVLYDVCTKILCVYIYTHTHREHVHIQELYILGS